MEPLSSQLGFALVRYRLRRALARRPRLHRVAVLSRPHEWRHTVGKRTDIVIEGFPRSGNNFAFEAFTRTNPDARIASRTHAPGAVVRAARRSLPVLLVVRMPEAAVSSLVIRQPYLGLREALADWVDYHHTLWPWRDDVVIGTFEQVTREYGAVIERVNARFGTAFVPYRNTEEADAATLQAIEDHHRSYHGGHVLETHVARPSVERQRTQHELRAALGDASVAELGAQAAELYERFSGLADASG